MLAVIVLAVLGAAVQHRRFVRRQVHQLFNRGARAADAPVLQPPGQREQKAERSGLGPLTQHAGAGEGQRHQQVHIGPQLPQRAERLRQRGHCAGHDRQQKEDQRDARRGVMRVIVHQQARQDVAAVRRLPSHAYGERHAADQRQYRLAPPAAPAGRFLVLPYLAAQARRRDGPLDPRRVEPPRVVLHRHPRLHDVERELAEPVEFRQRPAQQCYLVRAIHANYAVFNRALDENLPECSYQFKMHGPAEAFAALQLPGRAIRKETRSNAAIRSGRAHNRR